jgi:hypothetical protein
VAFNDLFANSESHSRSRVLVVAVQAAKDLKNPLGMPHFESDAVVSHAKQPFCLVILKRNPNLRFFIAAEFDAIRKQILENLQEL